MRDLINRRSSYYAEKNLLKFSLKLLASLLFKNSNFNLTCKLSSDINEGIEILAINVPLRHNFQLDRKALHKSSSNTPNITRHDWHTAIS